MPATRPRQLPRFYAITGEAPSPEEWWRSFERLLRLPDTLVQLRLQPAQHPDPEALLAEAVRRAHAGDRRVLVNGPPALALSSGADGVHLTARRLMACERRPLGRPLLVGASCHDAAELQQAAAIDADFACLSPLHPTRSHPEAQALGMANFKALVAACPLPVFALGGVGPEALDEVRAAGGHGVAGISAYWGSRPRACGP